MYDYKVKASKSRTYVELNGGTQYLYSCLCDYGVKYGFNVNLYEQAEGDLSNATIRHLIWVVEEPFSERIASEALELLGVYSSISVAFKYASREELYSYEDRVHFYKGKSDDRINFFMPDNVEDGIHVVSMQKILDNAVCDTVRVKYSPVCKDDSYQKYFLNESELAFFSEVSEVYRLNKLWFRARTDGYFAIRTGDGFAITSTKSDKVDLNIDRISIVTSYEKKTNELYYKGAFLPSSDAVEAALVFEKNPEIDVIVHTHASHLFTRNDDFSHRVLVPQLPYGDALLGDSINSALLRVVDGFVILDQHGEVFCGKNWQVVKDTIDSQIAIAQKK